jgi:2-oxoglutarate/2-oxoacid ferredoxin oxidoreductase subunit beta
MEKIYGKQSVLAPQGNTFCPGCGHSTLIKIISEVLVENGWVDRAIQVNGVGCNLNTHGLLGWDMVQGPHGRAAAVASGVKHAQRGSLTFTYQGDGDASCIGVGETFHAASRKEPITAIMINNQIYGMTGGQSSPTTLLGQRTTTDVTGRKAERSGYPTRLAEVIATFEGPAFVGRFSLHSPKHILQTKKALERAFRLQLEKNTYSFIEILSMCPTNWHINTMDTPEYIKKNVLPVFPLGILREPEKVR